MKKNIQLILILNITFAPFLSLMAQNDTLTNEWKTESVTKVINNIRFTFPKDGYAFEKKEEFVTQCLNVIKPNCQLIGLNDFEIYFNIKFYKSKEAMKKDMPFGYSGASSSYNKTVYFVTNENFTSPPIKHELMHLIATINWGEPNITSQWLNEGLATYAQNNCNGLKIDKIYRYLLESNKLISIDSLSKDFYRQPEMIAYHQSAYMVECLITKFGIEKFKLLWQKGFIKFNDIYKISFKQFESTIQMELLRKLPEVEQLDWTTFMLDCK